MVETEREKNVYLDYNATTPLAPPVIKKIEESLQNCWANPSSCSKLGLRAKQEIEEARIKISEMIESEVSEIIFTSGGTEASNLAIRSAIESCKGVLDKKPHIVTSAVEHDATLKIIEHFEINNLIEVSKIGVDKNGSLSCRGVLDAIRPNTRLITLMLANNETGVVFQIEEIGKELKAINHERLNSGMFPILLHTDAAQAIGKIRVSVRDLHCDYASIVGHKFYGPRIGCLFKKQTAPLIPLMFGGGQENGFRPGTENTPMIAGLGEAAFLVTQNLDIYHTHMTEMRDYLENKLMEQFGKQIIINFKTKERLPNTLSVAFLGHKGYRLLSKCKWVVASTGAACHFNKTEPSRILLESISPDLASGTLRLSVGRETTKQDIDLAVKDICMAYHEINNPKC